MIDNKTRALEDRTLNFKASINDSKSSRSGVISIKGEGEGLEYTVSQEPIKIFPSNISFVEGDNLLLSDNSCVLSRELHRKGINMDFKR